MSACRIGQPTGTAVQLRGILRLWLTLQTSGRRIRPTDGAPTTRLPPTKSSACRTRRCRRLSDGLEGVPSIYLILGIRIYTRWCAETRSKTVAHSRDRQRHDDVTIYILLLLRVYSTISSTRDL